MAGAIAELLDVSRALVGIAVYSVNVVPVDITVTQFRLLAVVASAGPRTIGEVAALLGVAQSNASRHCDRVAAVGTVATLQLGPPRTVGSCWSI